MKAYQRLFLVFAIACFLLSAAAFASSLFSSKTGSAPTVNDSYVIKSDGDLVRVYSDTACTEQIGVLDIRANELPEEDRGLLECGLLIESEEQLLSVLEDYTG